jgi:hypothetical protein
MPLDHERKILAEFYAGDFEDQQFRRWGSRHQHARRRSRASNKELRAAINSLQHPPGALQQIIVHDPPLQKLHSRHQPQLGSISCESGGSTGRSGAGAGWGRHVCGGGAASAGGMNENELDGGGAGCGW